MKAQEGKLVPIAKLGDEMTIHHAEEAVTTDAQWIAPFKNRSLPVFEEALYDICHQAHPAVKQKPPRIGAVGSASKLKFHGTPFCTFTIRTNTRGL